MNVSCSTPIDGKKHARQSVTNSLFFCFCSTLEMMPDVAKKILSKDPVADDEQRKEEEEAKLGGGRYGGTSKQKDLTVIAILLS